MMLGIGVGAIVVPFTAQRLIAMFGWRAAHALFGRDQSPAEHRVSLQCVVHDLADEKNGRERESRQHAFAS